MPTVEVEISETERELLETAVDWWKGDVADLLRTAGRQRAYELLDEARSTATVAENRQEAREALRAYRAGSIEVTDHAE